MTVPFSKNEIIQDGESGKVTLNPPISPRENYIRAAKHQNPLWIPMKSDAVNFAPRIYPDNVARAFVVEGQPYDGPSADRISLVSRGNTFQWRAAPW